MQARVYPPFMQGTGEFDGGRIVEQKPIGFPGEGSVVKRAGPLFYWAWAVSGEEAEIGLHPHRGFEILTYVVEGAAYHGDTLGTDSMVGAGGVQVMQTGSGVSHKERLSAGSELFQIWFEPEWNEAIRRMPTYRQHEHEDFPSESRPEGALVKTVIGSGSPVQLVVDADMRDVEIEGGGRYRHPVQAGHTLTALLIRGQGEWFSGPSAEPVHMNHKDFVLAPADADTEVEIRNPGQEKLRMILIQVPTVVDYPLYPKR